MTVKFTLFGTESEHWTAVDKESKCNAALQNVNTLIDHVMVVGKDNSRIQAGPFSIHSDVAEHVACISASLTPCGLK